MDPAYCFACKVLFHQQGHVLSCQNCVSSTGVTCGESLQTCHLSADACITTFTETRIGNKRSTWLVRSCGQSSDCNKTLSLSNPSMTVNMITTCCNTDDCIPKLPPVPPSNDTLNGVTCKSCLDVTSSSCDTTDTVNCTGVETKCISYAVTTTFSSQFTNLALRGCAAPGFCNLGSTTTSYQRVTIATDVACTDSSILIEQDILLLAMTGFLLLKLI
ncbi:phospholipase A2 inhibitor and Ly6/PLAUR domain-containing protein-like isoform X2 [Lissotriton helveticus]